MTETAAATTEPEAAWQPWPEPILDNFGYPTADALDYIRGFYGTPAQLVEFMEALYRPGGFSKVEDHYNDLWKRDEKKISFVTGGWSGCEEAIGVLSQHTVFHTRFWESEHRGGLDIYHVPVKDWDVPAKLGSFMPHPEAEPEDGLNEMQLRYRLERALHQARRHRRRAALANWTITEMKAEAKNRQARLDADNQRIADLAEDLGLNA